MDKLNPEQLQLTEDLKTARGQRFGELIKETYYSLAPQLLSDARIIIATNNRLTLSDIVQLAIAFNLRLKHCFDFLEDPIDQILPSGTYQKLLDRGLKSKLLSNQNMEVKQ
jgi:hypothetical protein